MQKLTSTEVRAFVKAALAEDLGSGDATTIAIVPANVQVVALMRAREPLVVAGLAFAQTAFRLLSQKVEVQRLVRDGANVKRGDVLMKISGPARAVLTAERVALNFVQRLSGVATCTSQFVQAIKGTRARILDTRKTIPGWRRLEKYAVACGGGRNHRFGLYDMILVKDNHLVSLKDAKPNAIAAAVERARKRYPKLKVEVEADNLKQVEQAVQAKADFVLLDNMSNAQLRKAMELCRGRVVTEASGGVNLKTVRGIAKTGVDFISVGALTHSARAVDIGLDFEM